MENHLYYSGNIVRTKEVLDKDRRAGGVTLSPNPRLLTINAVEVMKADYKKEAYLVPNLLLPVLDVAV